MAEKTRNDIREEALSAIWGIPRCGAAVSGGAGKTLIGLCHAEKYLQEVNPNARFLVVAPGLEVFSSWKNDAQDFGKLHVLDRIEFSTYISLHKRRHHYDIIYLDESDCLREKHEPWMSEYPGNIVGLTATPSTQKHTDRYKMMEKYYPIAYTYKPDNAIEDGVLNDYRIIVHTVSLSEELNIEKTSKTGKSWTTSEKKDYDYWTRTIDNAAHPGELHRLRLMRMKTMQGFRSKEAACMKILKQTSNKCLIFANTKEQADRVCLNSYYSGNLLSKSNMEMFNSGEIMQMSCVDQINRGVTIKGLNELHVLHTFANERKFAQRLFRGLRLSKEQICTIHCYVYKDTVDVRWAKTALESFDQSKITWLEMGVQQLPLK
jgi:superfamily II DNA or RNA helicase